MNLTITTITIPSLAISDAMQFKFKKVNNHRAYYEHVLHQLDLYRHGDRNQCCDRNALKLHQSQRRT